MKNYKIYASAHFELTEQAYKAYANSDYSIGIYNDYENLVEDTVYAIYNGLMHYNNIVLENLTFEEVNRFFVAEAIENLSNLYPVKLKYGIMYQQTQNAYLDYNSKLNRDVYTAKAIDINGNNYSLIWEVTDKESEDESNACDWSEFEVIEEI